VASVKPNSSHLVITTINSDEHEGNLRHIESALRSNRNLIVIGDKNTPEWKNKHQNIEFISTKIQESLSFRSTNSIPFNTYCRKNIGYLIAASKDSDWIAETDDDNQIYDNFWTFPRTAFYAVNEISRWVNLYRFFGAEDLWPRGIPLESVRDSRHVKIVGANEIDYSSIGCIQGIADGDPDVDAIGRMLHSPNVIFSNDYSFIVDKKNISPTNSQVTFWKSGLLPLLYLPHSVLWRVADIWRGLIAQVWTSVNHQRTLFVGPRAYQDRNPHILMDNFRDELPVHVHTSQLLEICDKYSKEAPEVYITLVYSDLVSKDLVSSSDFLALRDYLMDAQEVRNSKSL
jgi:hypothetical protein